jgi:dihydroorotate dehydrogenase electron transfer subunit
MRSDRGTIFLERGEILQHLAFPAEQYVLRVIAPKTAATAVPGSFAHIRCDDAVPLRRPLSIMRTDPDAGWVEFLYKPVGEGLSRLAQRAVGETLDLLGPIGRGFALDIDRTRILALGGGVGIPPMIFVADWVRTNARFEPLVLMGSEVPFPFTTVEARVAAGPQPAQARDAVALLEDWGVPSRLASKAGLAGSFDGYVTDLARHGLAHSSAEQLAATQILACGPEPMLRASANLAAEFDLPCQLALEEFMACGVGGCAGCTVLLATAAGPAMKRVCVDGPVFDAREVYPDLAWSKKGAGGLSRN